MTKVHTHPLCRKFIENLPESTRVHIGKSIYLLKTYGYLLSMPQTKKIAINLYEFRVRGELNVRLFYSFINQEAYIIHGFIKKSNKIPSKELKIASKRLKLLTNK
ncbi:MAG: hypothetical protein A2182_00015 [Candidatus Pacebacteria bacterium RIFOXYA1_FULL_38_18]|nr:MAG: hypothetical protein A2182_00015 [Candidatus Pacebacteria bacterium RIFOXYA1_FULL_38_18]OGJ39449.1 MAG: hypothetical protein A2411_01670 [Candidatus Pacebacteria bacterium RIFOXYC1_FULL_39_21]